MEEQDEYTGSTALDLIVDFHSHEAREAQNGADQKAQARQTADDARLALATLVPDSCVVIAARLRGLPVDMNGVPFSEERERTAWEILSRTGVPKLRATAIAASIFAAPQDAAPGSPGWVDPASLEEADEQAEIDPASVDAQISAMLEGARIASETMREDKEKGK